MFLNSSTLASLRFFSAAARTLSFRRAALELHVTQGAVSQHIKHLEEALGIKLFYRLVRQISLTEEGERFAKIVQRALDDLEHGAEAITALQSTIEIRVRASPSFALRWLVPRLGDFHARHPGFKLSVNAAYGTFDPARREFDLAIERLRARIPGIHSEALMEDEFLPVCSPRYLKHLDIKKPADLKRCVLLHDAQPWAGASRNAEWRHWLNAVGLGNVDSTGGQFFSLAIMAVEAALAHQGVALGHTAMIEDLLVCGRLVAPVKQRVASPTRYYLVYHKEIGMRPGIRTAIAWLREQTEKNGQHFAE